MKTPIMIAPTGLTSIAWPNAELLAARAADRAGAGLALSTYASNSIEEVAKAGVSPRWFQLYVSRDRKKTDELIDRAQAAGFKALAITVDTQVPSMRERNVRNGYQAPPRITVSNVAGRRLARRLAQAVPRRAAPGLPQHQRRGRPDPEAVRRAWLPACPRDRSLGQLERHRAVPGDAGRGRSLLKGVVSTRDVKTALEHGVNGFIVSNHGGRQLDYAPSSIEVLPEIVDACGDHAEVYLDSGIRRGSDIVKARGARARRPC